MHIKLKIFLCVMKNIWAKITHNAMHAYVNIWIFLK